MRREFLLLPSYDIPQYMASDSNLRRSVDNINKHLRGTKKLDLFECALVDPNVPIEESTKTLQKLIEEGKFTYIGISEPDSAILRRAHAAELT
jgi:pyridoxine 4-dehydrogenase